MILGHKSIVLNTLEFQSIEAKRTETKKGDNCTTFLEKGKAMPQETTDLVHAFYEDDEYSRQLPRKKDYVTILEGVNKQKWLVLCSLHELFVSFKEKTQM